VRIAIPVVAGHLCPHFGHCEQFAVVNVDPETKELLSTDLLTPPPHEPGVLPRWLREQEANVIIAGGMGRRAQDLFSESGITVVVGAPPETPEQLATAYLNGSLQAGGNPCDH
jgi:predicted Fe-Mo cluster-binding NifX family protein